MIGILTGARRFMDSLIGPLHIMFMLTPSLLIVFLSVFTFGFYDYVPSLAAAIVHTPFTAVVIRGQMLNPPREKLEMAHAYGAGGGLIIRHIYIPYLVPTITSEARVAYAHAWKITVLAEIFGFSSGAGYMIKIYFASLDIARVLAWALILIVTVMVVEEVLRVVEKNLSRWRGRNV
ncbi:MAG: ABC transporter permease subunit [Candidatus Caldarchaeum sp.]